MRGKSAVKGTNDWRQQQRKAKEQNDGKVNIEISKENPIISANNLTVQHHSGSGTYRKNTRSKSVPSMPLNFRPDFSNPNHLTTLPSERVRKRSMEVSNGMRKRSDDVSNGSGFSSASCRCARERRVSTSSCGSNCPVVYPLSSRRGERKISSEASWVSEPNFTEAPR